LRSELIEERSLRALEYGSVLEMLAQGCSCRASADRARSLRPFADCEDARAALKDTDDAYRLMAKYGGPSFSGLEDLSVQLQRARIGASLQPGELMRVAAVLAGVRALVRYRETTGDESTGLDGLFDTLAPNKYLEEKITTAIRSEDEISDAASTELADIRRHMRAAEARVREQLDKMIRSQTYQKYLQDPIVTMRSGRFVVPVRTECRADVPGLIHDTSASGATVFIEPMPVVEANNELRLLGVKEQKEIERILAQLSAEVGEFADRIEDNIRAATKLDFIFAKARLGYKMKASAPEMGTDGMVDLHKARHPLIAADKVVPVDIRLGGDFDTLVVTGPNTGGKTVTLKTLGLITLMAMSGLMVPASEESKLSFFDGVLADIGDEQSIEQSLSTFSSHMTNIIGILSECGPGKLVLLDELGSGTDPVEGAALAVSILEYLREKGAVTAATTHYAELKAYALQTPGVENACCEFDVATLRPTYRLLIGVPGRSNAFAISEKLGLDKDIIGRAQSLISSENTRFEEVVSGLEESRQQMEHERDSAARFRLEAQKAHKEAEQLKNELSAKQEQEIDKARVQARRIVEQTRAQAQEVLDEIESLRKMKSPDDIAALGELARAELGKRMNNMERTADPVSKRAAPQYKLPRPLRPGDAVLITDVNKEGTVLHAQDSSGYVEVQAGIITTRVPVANLRLMGAGKDKKKPKYTVSTHVERSSLPAKSEVDLRGMTVDEALTELDRFIDSAQMSSLSVISIIHGKGTGALRGAVQQHLKKHPSIKAFRLGRYGEGEDGVTIAELN
jgi:DNA mismatch repair protein MutS2